MITVSNVALVTASDVRGLLSAAQCPDQLPFEPARVFVVTESPAGTVRGGHAHLECHQVLIATAGTVLVEYDDGNGTGEVTLCDARVGLHIPPLVWAKQTYVTDGASLLVLASHKYDQSDYVDDRAEAERLRQLGAQTGGQKSP